MIEAAGQILNEMPPDRGFAAELLSLPAERLSCGYRDFVHPGRIRAAWKGTAHRPGPHPGAGMATCLRAGLGRMPRVFGCSQGARRPRSVALDFLLASGAADAGELALHQFEQA